MQTLEVIFSTAFRQLRPRTPLPQIEAEFFPFAGLSHTARLQDGRLVVRVSDIFMDAPADIHYSIALILLAKLYRKKIDTEHQTAYRTFILQSDFQEKAQVVRSKRGRIQQFINAQGRHVDLEKLFDEINSQRFASSIPKPRLSWSKKKSHCVLGRYDATHNAIYISRLFDSPAVPSYVVEYVLFHEMLHIKHQSRVRQSRVCVHTPEFKNEERSFPQYSEAKLWLDKI